MARPAITSPSVRRRRLATELRALREAAGHTGHTAARALTAAGHARWQQSKIARIEGAQQGVSVPDLEQMLTLYGATDPDYRAALVAMARDAKQTGWWADYEDVFGQSLLPDFEAGATTIRTYEAQAIPGLLQTPAYIEAVFRAGSVYPDDAVHRHVAARLQRQAILDGHHPVRLSAVVDEAALHRAVGGPDVMHDQLRHLANMAARHHVDLRVLPFAAGADAGLWPSFDILEFGDPADAPVAVTQAVTSIVVSERPHQVERCAAVFGRLQGAALPPTESVELITTMTATTIGTP